MARAILNISIPETMKAFIEKRALQGYGSVSEYMRKLIRQDEWRYRLRQDEAIARQRMFRCETAPRNTEVDLDHVDYPD